MKLQLEHLAPYLPYGLKFTDNFGHTRELSGLSIDGAMWHQEEYNYNSRLSETMPIFRPLSDLPNSEISDEFSEADYEYMETCQMFTDFSCSRIEYGRVLLLFENHFDVFDLIPAGLAIAI